MTPPPAAKSSPFRRADTLARRLKLFLFGEFGAGKTTLALQFYRPVVIDMEGGTDLYGEAFEFDVVKATSPDEVMRAVDWLLTNEHPYATLVIDPITVFWAALQKKWSDIFLLRNKGSKGYRHEFYDLQPRDWMTIKAELNELIRKLIALDMNVVVTARQKTKYAEGTFMRAIGETFDGEKSLPYLFDVIIRLYRDDSDRVMAECLKDRTNKLPKDDFECSYPVLEEYLGKENLRREATRPDPATSEQKDEIQNHLEEMEIPQERIATRIAEYGVDSIDELSRDDAQQIIEKLRSARAAGQ